MPLINWAAIDWVSLVVLSLLVLIVAHIGERLSFGSRTLGAVVTALLFAVGFAVWSYGVDDAFKPGSGYDQQRAGRQIEPVTDDVVQVRTQKFLML